MIEEIREICSLIKESKKARNYPLANQLFGTLCGMCLLQQGVNGNEALVIKIEAEEKDSPVERRWTEQEVKKYHHLDLLWIGGTCIPLPLLSQKSLTALQAIDKKNQLVFTSRCIHNRRIQRDYQLSSSQVQKAKIILSHHSDFQSWIKIKEVLHPSRKYR